MIGDNIRKHRKRNHLSQDDLAERLGVSLQVVGLWENNQTQPTLENIVTLSTLFGISTDELLAGNENKSNTDYSEPAYVAPITTPPLSQSIDSHSVFANQPISEPAPTYSNQPQAKRNSRLEIVLVFIILLVFGILAVWFLFFKEKPLSAEKIYTKIAPSVVEITAESPTEISTGTGFFLDEKGTVITNYHVIEGCQMAVITLKDGSNYPVKTVIGYDESRDIAILSTSCQTSKPLLIRQNSVQTGENVYALGSSLGLTSSLSNGIISATDRIVDGQIFIQTTAPISQGNSGGPLVDAKGDVIGVVCASLSEGQNLNIAIPISELSTISVAKNTTLEELFPLPKVDVEWISDWRFFYYEEYDSYVLLFQLANKEEIPVAVEGTVDICIVNNKNVTVYEDSRSFVPASFEEWIYDDTDEMYLATIYISPNKITNGSTAEGTIYFEVYGENYAFEECSEPVDCLPVGTPQKFVADTVGIRTITFSDKSTANTVVSQWERGDRSEKSLISIMNEYGANQGGGKLHTVYVGDFVREIDDWCFSPERKVGDYTIIKNIYGYSWCYISSIG